MGMFSWITQDTHRSICNVHSDRTPFTVYMTDDKGNKWQEDAYNGYGDFGGKDYYELLAEMNGLGSDRSAGVALECGDEPFKAPNLTEDPDWQWVNECPQRCPDQGIFYL